MPSGRILITGATGMVGAILAERAAKAGYQVRAMVRLPAEAKFAPELGIELYQADLSQTETLAGAVANMDYVVHAAAKVGDWGHADDYRAINVFALEHLLTAAQRGGKLKRWVQISSLGVYPARDHYGTDESTPANVSGLDGYTRTKAEAELLLKRHQTEHGLPAVILRPGFIYGPGDRHVVPRLIEKITSRQMKILGDGQKVLNNTYAGNLVDAIMLALESPAAVGETFNVRDERLVSRVEFIGTIADYIGQPRPGHLPLPLARTLVPLFEGFAKLRGAKEPPRLTKAAIKFMSLNLDYSIGKAKSKLGYVPKVDFQEGMQVALASATGKPPAKPAPRKETVGAA